MNVLVKDEIVTIKLVNGEEIVTKIVEIYDDVADISHPISMILGPQGLQMMPCLFSSNPDKNVSINMDMMVMVSEPRDDVRAKYIEATTGIATVPNKQIITG